MYFFVIGHCDLDDDGIEVLPSHCDLDDDGIEVLPSHCDLDDDGIEVLPGHCDFDDDGIEVLPSHCDFDDDGIEVLPGHCDFDDDGIENINNTKRNREISQFLLKLLQQIICNTVNHFIFQRRVKRFAVIRVFRYNFLIIDVEIIIFCEIHSIAFKFSRKVFVLMCIRVT